MEGCKVNERRISRLFPRASKSFIKLNSDRVDDPGMPDLAQSLDRKEVCKTQRGKAVDEKYSLKHVAIEFFSNHGRRMDKDNCAYVAKPILDALVNLGFADDDKEIDSEVIEKTGLDKDHSDLR